VGLSASILGESAVSCDNRNEVSGYGKGREGLQYSVTLRLSEWTVLCGVSSILSLIKLTKENLKRFSHVQLVPLTELQTDWFISRSRVLENIRNTEQTIAYS
jgi:hypothetical protein